VKAAVLALLVAAALAGCGGDDEQTAAPATPSPAPSAATDTPTATPTETAIPSPTATDAPTPENPEDQPGGAGDEEEIRVPVEYTLRERGISPPQVAVPAFLALELIINNETADTVVVRLDGAEPMTVAPGETGRARLPGRKKGQYVLDASPVGQALLITGAKPGP
jgi:hypothetical protein